MAFPGDKDLVRDFVTAHELGHSRRHFYEGDYFWNKWQGETNADQDAFRGLGERATYDFQRSILAARAGNALESHSARLIYGSATHADNRSFIHASVLGTFLPEETPYEVTEAGLKKSLDEFRESITGKLLDNHIVDNPDFELDISILTSPFMGHDDTAQSVSKFDEFIAKQDPYTASFYTQFQQNMNALSRQVETMDTLTDMAAVHFGALSAETEWQGPDYSFPEIRQQICTEYHQALEFMRETHPELFREYIIQNHPDLIMEQTQSADYRRVDTDTYSFKVQLAEMVMQLRDEGAYDHDPIQKRLADYIEIDMQIRPELYQKPDTPEQDIDQFKDLEGKTVVGIVRTPM